MSKWKNILAAALMTPAFVEAQVFVEEEAPKPIVVVKLPEWVNTPPSMGRAVGRGESLSAARVDALRTIMKKVSFTVEAGSLYSRLPDEVKGNADLVDGFITAAEGSSFLATKKDFVTDTATFVYCEMTGATLKALGDSLYQEALGDVADALERGHRMELSGDLCKAVKIWGEGLEAVASVIYKKLPMEDGSDGACSLYEKYVTAFDSLHIEVTAPAHIPMVKGEAVPMTATLKVTAGGFPVSNFPIVARFESGDGELKYSHKTNDDGVATLTVSRTPMLDTARIVFPIIEKLQASLSPTFASAVIKDSLSRLPQPAALTLVAFDPTPTVWFSIAPTDTAIYEETFHQWIDSCGFRMAADSASADLVLTATDTGETTTAVATDEYQIVNYNATLVVRLFVRGTGEELIRHAVENFQIKQPKAKAHEKMRAFAISKMLLRQSEELAPQLKSTLYDKRGVVFSQMQ